MELCITSEGDYRSNGTRKFAELIEFVADTEDEVLLIGHPPVRGDSYAEIVESLNRIANCGEEAGDHAE